MKPAIVLLISGLLFAIPGNAQTIEERLDALEAAVQQFHPGWQPPSGDVAPVITSTPVSSATDGTPYSYQLTATGTPVPTFALDQSPSGMTIDASTGLISWASPVTGAYSVQSRASNGIPPDATQSYTLNVAAAPPPPPPPGSLTEAFTEKTLDDCKAELTANGGGWCEMRVSGPKPGISNVWPDPYPPHVDAGAGAADVLVLWTGSAYDQANQRMYFYGGGHGSYAGTEVYEFDMIAGRWTRLTDPAPMDFTMSFFDTYHHSVDVRVVPPATHTYDGLIFNTTTQTFFLWNMGLYNRQIGNPTQAQITPVEQGGLLVGARDLGELGGIFEFNPSRTQTRNGVPPLSWRRHSDQNIDPKGLGINYPFSLTHPNGRMMAGGYDHLSFYDLVGEQIVIAEEFASWAGYGDGAATYDPHRQWIWVIVSANIWAYDLSGNLVHQYYLSLKNPLPIPAHGKSIEFGTDGRMYNWDGYQKVYSYDPDTKTWFVEDWSVGGPYDGTVTLSPRTYSKFRHVGDDFFVGVATHKTGVWVYKPVGNWVPY